MGVVPLWKHLKKSLMRSLCRCAAFCAMIEKTWAGLPERPVFFLTFHRVEGVSWRRIGNRSGSIDL